MSDIEFSYPVKIDGLRPGKITHYKGVMTDDKAVLACIAERAGVAELVGLHADCTIEAKSDGCRYHVQGTLSAKMVQECVNTLEPIMTEIQNEAFEAWFVEESELVSFDVKKSRRQQESETTMEGEPGEHQLLDEDESPEAVQDGVIDLGEQVVQFLTLAVNPFPRKDGLDEVFEYKEFSKESPFASLAALKSKSS